MYRYEFNYEKSTGTTEHVLERRRVDNAMIRNGARSQVLQYQCFGDFSLRRWMVYHRLEWGRVNRSRRKRPSQKTHQRNPILLR